MSITTNSCGLSVSGETRWTSESSFLKYPLKPASFCEESGTSMRVNKLLLVEIKTRCTAGLHVRFLLTDYPKFLGDSRKT